MTELEIKQTEEILADLTISMVKLSWEIKEVKRILQSFNKKNKIDEK